MHGVFLLLPLFAMRYGLLGFFGKGAAQRAALFAPTKQGLEKTMNTVYQLFTAAIIIYILFLKVNTVSSVFVAGVIAYSLGVLLLFLSVIHFAKPNENGFNKSGLYRFSRNPMYVAYFVYFLGCTLLTASAILFLLLCVFQISAHWVILAEERWCIDRFGEEYIEYMKKVRRYV